MSIKITEITRCRICGNEDLVPILDLGNQALSGRFPGPDEPEPPKGPLQLVKCNNEENEKYCGLLQLKHSVCPEEMFLNSYGYRSGINQTMTRHLGAIVNSVKEMAELNPGDVIVDIGSNDATLLKHYGQMGLKRIGIDPTSEQFRQYYEDDMILVPDFFTEANFVKASPDKLAKVITSIAMFYDLESPMEFVADIKKCLHPDGIWIFEQSYMPTMLKMNSFDTICHEHLEYYALGQIDWVLSRNGLRIIDVEFNDINGGSFRVYACHRDGPYDSQTERVNRVFAEEKLLELDTPAPYMEFKDRVYGIRDKLTQLLTTERGRGKRIIIYGASTKGNVTLQFCDIGKDLITAAAERNPEKFGCRTPGTNIPIISETEARAMNPHYFLVLPWHFKNEFLKRETEFLASGGRFIFPLPEVDVVGGD